MSPPRNLLFSWFPSKRPTGRPLTTPSHSIVSSLQDILLPVIKIDSHTTSDKWITFAADEKYFSSLILAYRQHHPPLPSNQMVKVATRELNPMMKPIIATIHHQITIPIIIQLMNQITIITHHNPPPLTLKRQLRLK